MRPITSYVREVLKAYRNDGVDPMTVPAKRAFDLARENGIGKFSRETFVQTYYRERKFETKEPEKRRSANPGAVQKIGIYVSYDRREHLEQLKRDGVNLSQLFWEAVDEKYPDRERTYAYCANEMWSGGPCRLEGCPHCGGDGEYDPRLRPKFMFDL